MKIVFTIIEKYFLIILIIFGALGFYFPNLFIGLKPHIPLLLGLIMLGMGLTLDYKSIINVTKYPKWIFTGVLLQFILMPLFAYAIGKLLNLSDELLIGMIIVGACPGGTASNVMVYLSKSNLALSITLTLISTLLAPLLTPFWIYFLAGKTIDVSLFSLIKTTFWIVIFPLIDGLIIRKFFENKIKPIVAIFPSLSITCISVIIACVVALNKHTIYNLPIIILLAVALHNALGFISGYGVSKLLKFPKDVCKTIAIEVGMQNSGLGVSLALIHFSKLSALPGVIFSIWHNLAGTALVEFFKKEKNTL